MKTSERLGHAEAHVRAQFKVADAKAALHTKQIPPVGHSPAARIAAAVEAEALQREAPLHVAAIKAGLADAVKAAEREISAVEDDAAAARWVARYIKGEVTDLPPNLPSNIATAAMALRGQPGSAQVARSLQLSSDNAEEEASRMRSRWLARTEIAANIAANNHARKLYAAAGLERRARAAELRAQRYEAQRKRHMENTSRRRLSDV